LVAEGRSMVRLKRGARSLAIDSSCKATQPATRQARRRATGPYGTTALFGAGCARFSAAPSASDGVRRASYGSRMDGGAGSARRRRARGPLCSCGFWRPSGEHNLWCTAGRAGRSSARLPRHSLRCAARGRVALAAAGARGVLGERPLLFHAFSLASLRLSLPAHSLPLSTCPPLLRVEWYAPSHAL
jgi:hypothetical protein